MGMFDYVKVETVLPGNNISAEKIFTDDERFQTKSFDNMMDTYVISNRGELYREHWDYEWVDEPDRPIFKGYLKKIPESYRREYMTDFTGEVVFYNGFIDEGKRIWRDYTAKFSDGILITITYKDSPKPIDNSQE